MPFGIGEAIGGIGALGNLISGNSAANSQKELLRKQKQILGQQSQLFGTAQPYYGQLLQQYAGQAGVGPSAGVNQLGQGHFGLASGYGTAEDQLRLQQSQEAIQRQQQQGANQLRFQLGQRGLADASIGAALARNQAGADQQLAAFQRQLAIQAPLERERRMANLTGLLGLGFGQGAQASQGYGQQAAGYGNAAAGAFAGIGNILQQYQYGRSLQNYGQPQQGFGYGGGGGYGGGAGLGDLGLTQANLYQTDPYYNEYG